MSSDTENFIDELKKEHGEVKLTSIGSSIKICLVAEGTADIYPRFAPTMEWDTAAGHAIAKAARKRIISPGWVHSLGLQQRRSIKSLVYCKIKQTGNMKY